MKYSPLLIVIALIAFSGCSTYQSPARTDASCSISVRDPGRFPHRLAIVNIDGASTEPNGGLGGLPPSRFIVLPGHHVFKVRYTMGALMGFEKIEIDFEQSHSYTLCSDSKGNTFTAWFIDDATGKQIEQKQETDWKRLFFGKMGE